MSKKLIISRSTFKYSGCFGQQCEIIEKMGFKTTNKYYWADKGNKKTNSLKTVIQRLVYVIPSFRSSQVVIGKKVSEPAYDFWLTDANS